ncbi:MAG: methyltransferase domain-containing protein [Solidesulfovibrio sp.]|nr:methyltransferase domain-containing protein [Solidesulfovibrio sp.]
MLRFLVPWLAARHGRLLEVGCGARPYRHLVPARCRYQGLDWEKAGEAFGYREEEVTLFTGGTFPFPDGSYDSLFHTEVLEHIPDPGAFLKECRRVLAPGGALFLSVPFQARFHYIPYDYWRFTPSGLRLLLEQAGFTGIVIRPRGTDVTVAAYKLASLAYRWLRDGTLKGKCLGLAALPMVVPALVVGHASLAYGLGSPDDCLGYVAEAKA